VENVLSPNVSATLVVVRAGEGVWSGTARDGGAGDGDERLDGKITADPSGLEPIAGSGAPPKKIKPRDFLLVIDTKARRFATTEVTP
jgi:hypothetical protein